MSVLSTSALENVRDYNEAEIRFHVVDPIIRHMKYGETAETYLNLEDKLEYPYQHIGHRSKKDLPLGFPDYRAGLKGARGSFIIEAKAGSVRISQRDIEQAHSYAAHAQVGANYFALCDGVRFCVYETLSGHEANAVVDLPLMDINSRLHEIENVLSPNRLAENCKISHDLGLNIAPGLQSSETIRSGEYRVDKYVFRILIDGQDFTEKLIQNVPEVREMYDNLELMRTSFYLRVASGSVKRDRNGKVHTLVEFAGVTRQNQQSMMIMGIDKICLGTAAEFLSIDPMQPTNFESTTEFDVPVGTKLSKPFGAEYTVESNVSGNLFVKAAIYYADGVISGTYGALSTQTIAIPGPHPMVCELDMIGTLELQLI